MPTNYTYTLSLQDRMSATMHKITGASSATMSKFTQLNDKTKILQQSTKDFGGSIYSLKQKIDLLQGERDLIDPSNLKSIRQYNSEIKKLHKNVTRLETINGSKFKKSIKSAFNELPSFVQNPVVLVGAALGFAGKEALNFGNEMAKVNVTAQLDETGLAELSEKVKAITKRNSADITFAPIGLEKIISQTGDVALSLDILDQVQRGAKGGFVAMDVVAGALAQTMSIVGKENANASDVLDTFFAAKRVGAGEFADFARYMPNLIAGGSNLGIAYKEVAGTFAYMTGKGQSAERSAVLMENAFSALGKSDIQAGLAKFGVEVFDSEGKMRGLVSISKDLQGVLSGKNDAQKTSILEQIGLKDKEAKNAFAIMTADIDKFAESMDAVQNAYGETDNAIKLSANPQQKMIELWNRMKLQAVDLGGKAMPLFSLGLDAVSKVLDLLFPVVDGLVWALGGVFSLLSSGNPLMWGAVAGFGAWAIAVNAATIGTKAKALWDGVLATKTSLLTGAQWLCNAAMLANPITWIVVGVIALVAVIVYLCSKIQGWGSLWEGIVGFMKYSFLAFVDAIKLYFSSVINGIMMGLDMIKLGWYKFKEACGLGDSSENQSAIAKINADVEKRQKAITDGAKKVIENARKAQESLAKIDMSWNSDKSLSDVTNGLKKTLGIEVSTPPIAGSDIPTGESGTPVVGGDIPKGVATPSNIGASSPPLDLNKVAISLKGSMEYSAAVAKLQPIANSKVIDTPIVQRLEPISDIAPKRATPELTDKPTIISKLQRVIMPAMAVASVATISLPQPSEASLPPRKEIVATTTEHLQTNNNFTKESGVKSVTIENITIHIASASSADAERISEIVRMELSKIVS